MYARHITGKSAERLARSWLEQQGLSLIAENYRCPPGEIDLIMHDATHCVFIEVRSRNSPRYGGALASITPAKQRRIIRAADYFLQNQPVYSDMPCRFDVIGFQGEAKVTNLDWIRDAFHA